MTDPSGSLGARREAIAQRLLALDDFVNWLAVGPVTLEQATARARELRRTEFYPWEDEYRDKAERCGFFWSWWDGEYEGECELPKGHAGPHYDGASWADDEGGRLDGPT